MFTRHARSRIIIAAASLAAALAIGGTLTAHADDMPDTVNGWTKGKVTSTGASADDLPDTVNGWTKEKVTSTGASANDLPDTVNGWTREDRLPADTEQ
jgi:hypothetical protein